jgi:hypothetical protein
MQKWSWPNIKGIIPAYDLNNLGRTMMKHWSEELVHTPSSECLMSPSVPHCVALSASKVPQSPLASNHRAFGAIPAALVLP